VGYAGGHGIYKNPTYEQVSTGKTGHAESVQIEYDPDKIAYEDLLDIFWSIHDPTSLNRQGPDVGSQYRSAIFYHDENQKTKALSSKKAFQKGLGLKKNVVTEIKVAGDFYPAEEYHQQYFEKKGKGWSLR
jgi:peptide-methionine (S)-S-oxide reductase